ncbi:15692_t:CDS:1, partial [Gigaspora margarita]
NESFEVKTSNTEEEKPEVTQKLAITLQSAQVLKEDLSIVKKNRKKPNGIHTVWDIPRNMSPRTLWKELSFFGNVSIIQWRGRETSSAALIQIRFKSVERKQNWESKWAVAPERSGR